MIKLNKNYNTIIHIMIYRKNNKKIQILINNHNNHSVIKIKINMIIKIYKILNKKLKNV